jgi:hypothetical protein
MSLRLCHDKPSQFFHKKSVDRVLMEGSVEAPNFNSGELDF